MSLNNRFRPREEKDDMPKNGTSATLPLFAVAVPRLEVAPVLANQQRSTPTFVVELLGWIAKSAKDIEATHLPHDGVER